MAIMKSYVLFVQFSVTIHSLNSEGVVLQVGEEGPQVGERFPWMGKDVSNVNVDIFLLKEVIFQ